MNNITLEDIRNLGYINPIVYKNLCLYDKDEITDIQMLFNCIMELATENSILQNELQKYLIKYGPK